MPASSILLDSYQLGPLTLPNRTVMAPLTRSRAGEGDVPHQLNATYYRQRATAGLIISEATQIHPMGKGYPHTPGIYSDAQKGGWKLVTDAVHDEGGRIFAQLWHVGRISDSFYLPGNVKPVAPSALSAGGEVNLPDGSKKDRETPRALETEEVAEVVEQYRHAAKVAKDAGFDGIEIHAANTYLIDQFLRTGSNHRTDQYGGSLENRMRFGLDVARAVLDVWDADRVGVRLSPASEYHNSKDANYVETFTAFAEELNKLGVIYLHLVEPENFRTNLEDRFNTEQLRGVFKQTLIANGGYTQDTAEAKLEANNADLVAFGELYIANPDLPERFAQHGPFNEPDRSTYYGGGAAGYTDYPTLAEA